VARHADGHHVELRLDRLEGYAALVVRDDGRGIDPPDVSFSRGIRGMRERAMLIGAQLAINRANGRGTQVHLTIPLDTERECPSP
jgi:two-component system, NarL family, sensor histidine kinase UhpB